jgi:hypothetical protein
MHSTEPLQNCVESNQRACSNWSSLRVASSAAISRRISGGTADQKLDSSGDERVWQSGGPSRAYGEIFLTFQAKRSRRTSQTATELGGRLVCEVHRCKAPQPMVDSRLARSAQLFQRESQRVRDYRSSSTLQPSQQHNRRSRGYAAALTRCRQMIGQR